MSYEETPYERDLRQQGFRPVSEWQAARKLQARQQQAIRVIYKTPGGYRSHRKGKQDNDVLAAFTLGILALGIWTLLIAL